MNLKKLNLASNEIKNEGAKGLAKNRSWHELEELHLRNNQIGDDGARFLSANIEWKRLKNIYLGDNKLSNIPDVMRSVNEKYSKQLVDIRKNNPIQFEEEDYRKKAVQIIHEEFQKRIRTI